MSETEVEGEREKGRRKGGKWRKERMERMGKKGKKHEKYLAIKLELTISIIHIPLIESKLT